MSTPMSTPTPRPPASSGRFVPPRRRNRVDTVVGVIGVIGRIFVVAGVMLLFFTAYLLWGTGVYTKQQQSHFKAQIGANPIVSDKAIAEGKIPAARPTKAPKLGDPLFSIKVPKIGLDTIVVEGVGVDELKKGPGLFPDCATKETSECVSGAKYPGENGNVAISGHRTTYGAPFFRLNELKKGDVIDFVSGRARYRYRVREQKIVDPVGGFQEVEQAGRTELTLTSCHPRFSAAQRLVIKANFEGSSLVAAGPSGQGPQRSAAPPVIPTDVIVLGSVAIASALASLGLSKRYRWTAAYVALGIVGAAGLWVGVFPRVLSLMPENF
jgi:sortase A